MFHHQSYQAITCTLVSLQLHGMLSPLEQCLLFTINQGKVLDVLDCIVCGKNTILMQCGLLLDDCTLVTISHLSTFISNY